MSYIDLYNHCKHLNSYRYIWPTMKKQRKCFIKDMITFSCSIDCFEATDHSFRTRHIFGSYQIFLLTFLHLLSCKQRFLLLCFFILKMHTHTNNPCLNLGIWHLVSSWSKLSDHLEPATNQLLVGLGFWNMCSDQLCWIFSDHTESTLTWLLLVMSGEGLLLSLSCASLELSGKKILAVHTDTTMRLYSRRKFWFSTPYTIALRQLLKYAMK